MLNEMQAVDVHLEIESSPVVAEQAGTRPLTCSLTCYEIEPGRWVHHPWEGCRTPVLPAATQETIEDRGQADYEGPLSRPCWHCSGSAVCLCIGCAEKVPWGETGECTVCCGTGFAFSPHAVNWRPTDAEKVEWKRKHIAQVKSR